jgi:hypothetical protein
MMTRKKRRDQEVRERKAEGVWEERPGFVAKNGSFNYSKLGVKISLVST